MSRYAIKFPFRVRIHGGEFDESARAIHREDGLKTIQAESGIVLESTIERKQMSTKTTFKRIALVTVAALGFGVMSVAPSNAAPTGANLYHTIYSANGNCNAAGSYACSAYASDQSWVLVGDTASYGFQTTFLAAAANDAVTHTWTPKSAPVAIWQVPLITITPWKAADQYGPAGGTAGGFYGGYDNNSGWSLAGTSAAAPTGAAVTNGTPTTSGLSAITTATAAGGTIGNFKNSFVPTVAGDYVWELSSASGGPTYTWTIHAYATLAAKDAGMGIDQAISVAKTTSIINSGETTSATADATVVASKALSTDAVATIVVTPKSAADLAIANVTFPITATISGPGSLRIADTLANATASPAGRAVTGTTGHYVIGVFSDGNSGVATITISTGTTELAKETVTFYGAAASITPTVVKSVLAIGANAGAITAVVKDAAGVAVPGVGVWSLSDTDATIDDAPVSCGTSDATGAVSCGLTGVAAGTAGIKLMNAATVATSTVVTPSASSVRVSDGIATKVAYSFDKSTYAPGEAAVITATVSNAAGVMPAGTYTVLTAGVTGNYTIANGPGLTVTAVGNTGAATYNVTIPVGVSGALKLTGTAALVSGSTTTYVATTFGSADVVNAALVAAQEATDAANEATDAGNNAKDAADQAIEAADAATIAAQDAAAAAEAAGAMAVEAAEAAGAIAQDALDAANAATDAALSAAEAADAATAAATEAKESADAATAAVAELSTKVAALMAALNAKVTTLANLVAKIAKKVKA